MPTRKTVFWFISAAVLYLIAWNVGSGWLYVLVALLAGLPLASIVLARLNIRRKGVSQKSVDAASTGDSINVELTIENGSIFPSFFLQTEYSCGGSGTVLLLPHIKGGGNKVLTLQLGNLKRGVYPGGIISVESSAPIGLAISRCRFVTDNPLVVYPQLYGISGDWGQGWRDSGYMISGAVPTRHAASDFLGVREYRPEDSPRSIHWRTTARSNTLSVIEYAKQSAITPVFIVDTYSEGNAGAGPESSFETAVSMAASLVRREARHNRRFAIGSSLAVAAGHGLEHDPGPAMFWLAGIQAESGQPLDLTGADLPWPEVVPVLLLTSHVDYANIHESDFIQAFPGTIIIMIDGHGFNPEKGAAARFMDDEQLERLADGIESLGLRFTLVSSPDMVSQCLAKL